jgi:hypothetical protein
MAAFKSWFQPSLTVAAAVERSFETGQMRSGLTLQVSPAMHVCLRKRRGDDVKRHAACNRVRSAGSLLRLFLS